MDAPSKPLAADLSPAEANKWVGRLLIAVVMGAAIWNLVVTVTTAVVLPALAQVMETDPQSPLYLGKGTFNIPALFSSVLELCFAAIAALMVNAWSQRRPKAARRKSPIIAPVASLSISAPETAPIPEPARQVPSPVRGSVVSSPPPQQPVSPATSQIYTTPTVAPTPSRSEKPKPSKPKEVYYNSVGEIVERDD